MANSMNTFGAKIRKLRSAKGMTLRDLAQAIDVDFSYLSKIENGKAGYLPGADTIRALAVALDADVIELLELADKLPPEVERLAGSAQARRFLERANEIASADDWEALLKVLEERKRERTKQVDPERKELP